MHKWSFLLIACLAAIQPIASITDRRFFDGRQQCSRSGQIRNTENLLVDDNLNRKNPEGYRLNFWDSNRDNQQYSRHESRINRLNRNINHGHIEYREQTLARPIFIRDNVFDEIRNSRERSVNGDRRFEFRNSRRSFDRRAEITGDRYSRLVRDRRLVLRDHNYATSENQRRSYSERDLVSRDQTRANRDIIDNRRTDVRNQMRSATERNRISERHSERHIVFRDQGREYREIRDNRRSDVRNQMRSANERNVDNEMNRNGDTRYSERDQLRADRDNRDNRRDVHNLMRSTTESNIVFREARENREIRDNRRTDIRNQLRFATETNIESERNLGFRDQTRANREIRDDRRTEIRNQLRTTPERNVDNKKDGFLGKYSERLVFTDQTRANREIRDNRKAERGEHSERIDSSKRLQRFAENSRARVTLESPRRFSDNLETRKLNFLRNTPQRQRELHQNRILLTVRENRSDDLKRADPNRVFREIDVLKRERIIFTRNDIRENKSAVRQDARSQHFRINKSDSKMGHRHENFRFETHMDTIISPEKQNVQETSTFLPWYYVMYSLQAIYIYSIMSQLFTKTKGKKTFSHFTDMAFPKQIKAE